MIMALIISILLFVKQFRKKTLEYKTEKDRVQQQLIAARLEIQEQTMQHIGREIHDSVGQKLTLASLYAYTLVLEKQYPGIEASLNSIGKLINETLAELRGFSKNLTDSEFLNASFESLMEHECKKVNAFGKCLVTLNISGAPITMPFDAKIITLRLIQEFLQNSLKHASCKNIMLQTFNGNKGFRLNASDDGVGFDVASVAGKGIGLKSMKQRAATIGASIQVQSQKGQGTKLQFFIPIQNNQ
jgi:signal transduction histidine kinase